MGGAETCPVSTGGRDETCPVSTGGRGGGGRRMGGEGPAPPGANAACRSHPRDGGRVLLPAPRRRRPQKPAHEGEGESERKRWASGGGRVRGRRHPKLPRERVDERAGRSPHLARDAVHQRLRVLGWRHAAAARGAGAAAPPPPPPYCCPYPCPYCTLPLSARLRCQALVPSALPAQRVAEWEASGLTPPLVLSGHAASLTPY